MIEQVTRKVLSFADGVSSFSAELGQAIFSCRIVQLCSKRAVTFSLSQGTVWYGHSMGAIVAYEVLKRFDQRYRSLLEGNLSLARNCSRPPI